MKRFVILNSTEEIEQGTLKKKFALAIDSIKAVAETEDGNCFVRFADADDKGCGLPVEGTVEDIVAKIHEAQKGE